MLPAALLSHNLSTVPKEGGEGQIFAGLLLGLNNDFRGSRLLLKAGSLVLIAAWSRPSGGPLLCNILLRLLACC